MNQILRRSVITLGEHRGAPRIYLNGRYLARAAFGPGEAYTLSYERGRLVIDLTPDGPRKVSSKTNGQIPVIDLNSTELRTIFGAARSLEVVTRHGTIEITPARLEQHRARRVRNGLEGSIFAGGGLLTQAAKDAGYRCAFAIELNPDYAEVLERNHPGAQVLNCDIAQVDTTQLPQVELLTIGLPCECFSRARQNGRGDVPEDHDTGDLVYWALKLIDDLAPYTVVLEEVPPFTKSGAYFILTNALSRLGYTVETKILDPMDYGFISGRKRACVVATTAAEVRWPAPRRASGKLGDLLEDVPDDVYFDVESKPWIFRHWETQRAKGNGFCSAILGPETTRIPTITRRYFAQQGSSPVVRHPSIPDTFRWLTVREVSRLMGLSDDYDLNVPQTTAGEILGQGVLVPLFAAVIAANSATPPINAQLRPRQLDLFSTVTS